MSDRADNRGASASEEKEKRHLEWVKVELPEVYSYLTAHIDERARPDAGWHQEYAAEVCERFGLADELLMRLWPAIRALAMEKYRTYYPERRTTDGEAHNA